MTLVRIQREVELILPDAPTEFSVAYSSDGIETTDLPQQQILEIGRAWTNQLLAAAGLPTENPIDFDLVNPTESERLLPMSIGEIIDELKRAIAVSKDDDGGYCQFDWGGWPTGFCSYRGFYERLAWNFNSEYHSEVSAAEVLEMCESVVGRTFTGWKGGEYTMDANSEVHVAGAGGTTRTRVVGIGKLGYCDCAIITAPLGD